MSLPPRGDGEGGGPVSGDAEGPESFAASEGGDRALPDPKTGAAPPPRRRYTLLQQLEPLLWLGLVLFLLARFGPQLQAWTGIGPAPDRTVPSDLVFETVEGDLLGPAELEGRLRVVTFWATWCRVCRFELPSVQRVHERWGETGQVVVLGISIDRESPGAIREHVEAAGYTFPVTLALPGTREAFGGIQGVPTTFIVDGRGEVRHRLVGVTGPGTLQRAVARILAEEDQPAGSP